MCPFAPSHFVRSYSPQTLAPSSPSAIVTLIIHISFDVSRLCFPTVDKFQAYSLANVDAAKQERIVVLLMFLPYKAKDLKQLELMSQTAAMIELNDRS
jgi:hypothetical protein